MVKKIIALILSCLMFCACFISCSNNTAEEIPDFETIEYSEYEPFRFYCYGTPPPGREGYDMETQYKYIAECGFNYAVPLWESSTEERIAFIEGVAPYGIKVIVADPYVGNLYELYKQLDNIDKQLETLSETVEDYETKKQELEKKKQDKEVSIESAKKSLKKIYDIYSKYENFAGFNAKDEPRYDDLEFLGQTYDYFETINVHNKEWWINLFPNWGMGTLGSSFGDYVDTAAKLTGSTIMCYDTYPLDKSNAINSGYWTEMEQFATISRQNGKDFMGFILSEGHQTYKHVKDYDDLAYQVYSQMLFGSIGINTFKYYSTGAIDALISADGRRTSLYYGMQQIIKEVRAFENIYMNSEWQGVMLKVNDEFYGNDVFDGVTNPLTAHERIKSFGGTSDMALGAFKDKDGRDGFLIFNANNPADDTQNTIDIEFENANYAYLYKKGRKVKVKLENGKFRTTMGSCEAYYIVPIK